MADTVLGRRALPPVRAAAPVPVLGHAGFRLDLTALHTLALSIDSNAEIVAPHLGLTVAEAADALLATVHPSVIPNR